MKPVGHPSLVWLARYASPSSSVLWSPLRHPDVRPFLLRFLHSTVPVVAFSIRVSPTSSGDELVWAWLSRALPYGQPLNRYSLPDTSRASQVPEESFPCLCPALRSRPCLWCLPLSHPKCCPRSHKHEDHSGTSFSRLNHTASARAVYASGFGFPAPARLAFGWWPTFPEWDLNPLDSYG